MELRDRVSMCGSVRSPGDSLRRSKVSARRCQSSPVCRVRVGELERSAGGVVLCGRDASAEEWSATDVRALAAVLGAKGRRASSTSREHRARRIGGRQGCRLGAISKGTNGVARLARSRTQTDMRARNSNKLFSPMQQHGFDRCGNMRSTTLCYGWQMTIDVSELPITLLVRAKSLAADRQSRADPCCASCAWVVCFVVFALRVGRICLLPSSPPRCGCAVRCCGRRRRGRRSSVHRSGV